MMIAAVYARKSTEQTGVVDEQKSVTRQIQHARAYASSKGWNIADQHVYVDDGISGAEFANRPGFLRLMNSLKPRPAFDVLIMSEESRLGREAIETAYALKQIITSGVRVFFYLENRERRLESPTDKILLSLTTYADELEREKARQRVTDAMHRKARAGHVTGGRVFGYDNVEILSAPDEHGRRRRERVERRINQAEAAIVRRVFDLCAAGNGYTGIAKLLNADRVPCPRPQQGRPAGWAPSTVNDLLHRTLYRGEVIWNRTRKRDQWGQRRHQERPETEWMRRTSPSSKSSPRRNGGPRMAGSPASASSWKRPLAGAWGRAGTTSTRTTYSRDSRAARSVAAGCALPAAATARRVRSSTPAWRITSAAPRSARTPSTFGWSASTRLCSAHSPARCCARSS
jgi:DNA invertase Pin-like site-specific DNA recombinase